MLVADVGSMHATFVIDARKQITNILCHLDYRKEPTAFYSLLKEKQIRTIMAF